jgi:methyl-accepting chemotaxis protein
MDSQPPLGQIIRRLFLSYQAHSFVAIAPLAYLTALISGFDRDQAWTATIYLLPPMTLILGLLWPYWLINRTVRQAFQQRSTDKPGDRISRILKVPRQIELGLVAVSTLGIGIYVGGPTIHYGLSAWLIPWATFVAALLLLLLMVQVRMVYEQILRPYVIEDFHKAPNVTLSGNGFFWPRQRTYLPYAFGLFVVCTLAITATILSRGGYGAYMQLREQVIQKPGANVLALIDGTAHAFAKDVALPLVLLGGYLLTSAALAAFGIARNQSLAAKEVQSSMESLAAGEPRLPQWLSTDEIGDLALATAETFEKLKSFSLSLGDSAISLGKSAEQLGYSTTRQAEVLSVQAAALQETQVTAQEIKQTSLLASQKAEGVLQQVERADRISRNGEEVLQRSLSGLQEIGDQVGEMAKRIKSLDERTRQIANITTTVKDLADQSNMLALNAAIEAVRSGEHGKGFGVVAREIRALADQSIQATNNVREILQDIGSAIGTTVAITEKGSEKVGVSLVQIREFGESIRELSAIVRENAASVRQITAAVSQQNSGIGQIFEAVSSLTKMMDQTMLQLRTSDDALGVVRNVAEQVTNFIGAYGWKGMSGRSTDTGPAPSKTGASSSTPASS